MSDYDDEDHSEELGNIFRGFNPMKGVMSINFDKVLEEPDFSALTKATIRKLKKQQYFSIAEFVQWISTPDLEDLVLRFERMMDDEDVMQDILILSECLAAGEGFSITDGDDAHKNLNYFMTVVTCESLKRRGLVEMFYNKISLDNLMSEEMFVKLL